MSTPMITCPSCKGEGGEEVSRLTLDGWESDFLPCKTCNGEGKIEDEDYVEEPHYKETDEFDTSKEQDIKNDLREREI